MQIPFKIKYPHLVQITLLKDAERLSEKQVFVSFKQEGFI